MTYAAILHDTWEREPYGVSEESNSVTANVLEFVKSNCESISGQRANTPLMFSILVEQWTSNTAHLSSITAKAMHQAYQRIIGMGNDAIPLILSELNKEPGHWFWALRAITGEDPVLPEQRGQMQEMTEAWLRWGRSQGYRV